MERNLTATFQSVHDPTGKELSLLFGPALTGVVNIGNSCYMSSVVQSLAACGSVRARYGGLAGLEHLTTCRNQRPGACYLCQLAKVFVGLGSGVFALPPTSEAAAAYIKAQRATRDKSIHCKSDANADAAAAANGNANDDSFVVSEPAAKVSRLATDTDDNISSDPNTSLTGSTNAPAAAAAVASSHPVVVQPGVSLRALKKLFSAGNGDFSGNAQQCAYEYLCHVKDNITRS